MVWCGFTSHAQKNSLHRRFPHSAVVSLHFHYYRKAFYIHRHMHLTVHNIHALHFPSAALRLRRASLRYLSLSTSLCCAVVMITAFAQHRLGHEARAESVSSPEGGCADDNDHDESHCEEDKLDPGEGFRSVELGAVGVSNGAVETAAEGGSDGCGTGHPEEPAVG